jgi:hypothetical protein
VLGAGLILLSVLALVLSLGAPGLGWMLAVAVFYCGGLLAPRVARGQLVAVLLLGLFHLFWIGPLAGFRWPSGDTGAALAVFFLVLPLGTLCLAIGLRGLWKPRRPTGRRT